LKFDPPNSPQKEEICAIAKATDGSVLDANQQLIK